MNIKSKITISILSSILFYFLVIIIFIPISKIKIFAEENLTAFIFVLITAVLINSFIIYVLFSGIPNGVFKLKLYAENINKGTTKKNETIGLQKKDELGLLSNELEQLNKTITVIQNIFQEIKTGIETPVSLSKTETDIPILKELVEIKEAISSAEKEKKQSEEENSKIQWHQNGIADFTALLQQSFDSTQNMANQVVKKIVQYLQIEQVGFFILYQKNEKNVLILEAAYAYDKKRKLDAEIEIGEGIIGKCAKEQKTIKIENLPEGYTYISSGLGENSPDTLLLIPLIFESKLFGVLELASLKKISDYKIEFLNILSERLASQISNIRNIEKTKILAEDYNRLKQELAQKEKHITELLEGFKNDKQLLSEQIAENEYISSALSTVVSVIHYNFDGQVTYMNTKSKHIFKNKTDEYINNSLFNFLPQPEENNDWLTQFKTDLQSGKVRTRIFHLNDETTDVWLQETLTPVYNKENQFQKIINIGFDISRQKKLEQIINNAE